MNLSTVTEYMSGDHRSCDDLFLEIEKQVPDGDWSVISAAVERFVVAMEHHFSMEESVLFPAFETRTGMTGGPTQMMRMEHVQMRDLFAQMTYAAGEMDDDDLLGQCETLLMMMQQHNLKEEEILYPMSDQAIGADVPAVLDEMGGMAS